MQFRRFQCFSSVVKIRYINSCILSVCIISCCFQFIQVCSSLTCRYCWSLIFNSGANVVYDGVTTSCVTSCILEGYNNIISRNCCTSTIWFCIVCNSTCCRIYNFIYFSAISFSVNCWSYSIYSVSFLTCCSIRCFRYSYIVTSFNNCTKASDYVLACIIDVGKILFSNAFNNSFFSCSIAITINII